MHHATSINVDTFVFLKGSYNNYKIEFHKTLKLVHGVNLV